MADFSKRIEELTRELEAIRPMLPEEPVKNLTDAIAKYKDWRRGALDDLLKMLREEGASETARSWSDLCNSMREDAPEPFENALRNIPLPTEAAATGYHWQLTVMANEEKFFEFLGKTNAAKVRDYLCANRESLKAYTDQLDQKWRTIVDEGNKLQSDEKKLYDEMVAMTRRIIDEFAATERTYYEKARSAGQYSLIALENLGPLVDLVAEWKKLPEGTGKMVEFVASWLSEKNEQWLESNRDLRGRAANYRSLVQAEKGGVLPLFKETRRQVYEYWDRNNLDRARDWISAFRSSLEGEWVSACPTSGQQEDAKDFYKAALELIEKHFKAVEDVARNFEERWNGVFKGALAPKTVDELLDTASWRINAETLVNLRVPSLIGTLLEKMDGYYEESFEEPLENLKEKADQLEGEEREQALRAVDLVRKRVEDSVRARIKQLQREVGESLQWFGADEVKKTLDRSELADGLE